jgi:zinc protease
LIIGFASFIFFIPLLALSDFSVLETRLENGLTLLTMEDHSSPLAAAIVFYHVGSKDEYPGLTGMARICEHIASRGTAKFPKGEYARIIQAGGGTTKSYADIDWTVFSAKVPANMLDTVLFLAADRMENVEVTYEKLLMAKDAVRKERLAEVESSIYGHINEEVLSLAFRLHPYRNPRQGWPADINNITLADVKDFYRLYYQPANATIVIVGDFKTDIVISKVRNLFEDIIPGPPIRRRIVVEPERVGERRSYLEGISEIPAFIIGYHAPVITHEDFPAIRLISNILTASESSRLHKRMVRDEKSAMYVGGGYIFSEDPSLIFCYAVLNYDHTNSAAEIQMSEEITRLKSEYVTDLELETAKNRIEASHYRYLRTFDQMAQTIGFYHVTADDWKIVDRVVGHARLVTKEDILRVARKYFNTSSRTVVFLEPSGTYEDVESEIPE